MGIGRGKREGKKEIKAKRCKGKNGCFLQLHEIIIYLECS